MESRTFHSWSEKDTFEIGASIGRSCRAGEILLLDGDLGDGR